MLHRKPRPARGFVVFKWTVYALLALDVVLYAVFGRATELLDSAAWAALLVLFELETGGWRIGPAMRRAMGMLRVAAALGVAVSVIGYATEGEWLDFANGATWIAIVALLEVEVRFAADAFLRRWRGGIAMVLYGLLMAFVLLWVVQGVHGHDPRGAWLDAADGTLWLLAFAAVELNVFGWARQRSARD